MNYRRYECTRDTLLKFKEQMNRKEQGAPPPAAVAGTSQFVPSFIAAAPPQIAVTAEVSLAIVNLSL